MAARSGQVQQSSPHQRPLLAISENFAGGCAGVYVSKTHLLELLDGTLVDTAALVDQVTRAAMFVSVVRI